MDNVAVRVLNLSKCYKLYSHPWHRAAEWVSLGPVLRVTDDLSACLKYNVRHQL